MPLVPSLPRAGVGVALKEWDVVVAALEQGRQAILIRKGGLDDPGRRLPPLQGWFWLYPTLFHERAVFLKPECHAALVPGMHRRPRTLASGVPRPRGHPRPVAVGHVALRAVAAVVDAVPAPDLEALNRLTERTVWTEKYATLRFRWRPEERPVVLVLRVAVLPHPVEIPERPQYGGCRSLIHLGEALDASAARPVWSEDRLATEVEAVRRALASG